MVRSFNTKGEKAMTALVQAILATFETDRETRRLRALTELAALSVTIDAMVDAAGPVGGRNESDDWDIVFKAVFGGRIAAEQDRLFRELDLAMPDHHDPDGTPGQDATAWIEAYRSVARPLLDAVLSWGTADECLTGIADDLGGMAERAGGCRNGPLAALHLLRAKAALEVMAAAA